MASSPDLLTVLRSELDERLAELRPLVVEYERLLIAAEALGQDQQSVRTPRRAARPAVPLRAPVPVAPAPRRRGSTRKHAQGGVVAVAIVAALEHGSHTVSELAIVTAMSGSIINNNLRRLQQAGTITRTKREGDGKAAYALSSAPI